MSKNVAIVVTISIAMLIVGALYITQSNDESSTASSSASQEEAPTTVVPAASLDSHPLQVELPTQTNATQAAAVAQVKESPNRTLLNNLHGEEFYRLVKSLRLSAADSEKLLDILADELEHTQEWLSAHKRSFISQDEVNELRSDSDRYARELLGDEKFQRYDDYRKHPAERKQINRLSERLVDEDAPLYRDVEDQLYLALKEETNRTPAPHLSAFGSHMDYEAGLKKWRDDNTRRFLERAALLLSANQLTVLQMVMR